MLTVIPAALAFAAEAPQQGPSGILGFLPLIVIFVIFYLFLIRPQQKRAKEHREMLSKITRGDYVITNGGLHGRVTAVSEDTFTIEIAEGVRVKVSKNAVTQRKTAKD